MFEERDPNWFNQRMQDGGPVYMETRPEGLIVEPWNAFSSLLILIPAFYWIYRMRKEGNKDFLMWAVVILVITGGLGSALYHAFRVSVFFLIMDVLPSAILTLTLSVYFWIKVLKKWWYAVIVLGVLFGLRFLIWGRLPEHTSINISYFITGVSIGLPLIIFLFKTSFRGWQLVTAAILSFIIALTFRETDYIYVPMLPMGTHFLWHSFSALGAWFILGYLYMVTYKHLEVTDIDQP
jgi:hypothetical protein